jgi:hypothetical protein
MITHIEDIEITKTDRNADHSVFVVSAHRISTGTPLTDEELDELQMYHYDYVCASATSGVTGW